jgi:lysophospholipid acyltransferase (LPLAT)-like uncharacterized protein
MPEEGLSMVDQAAAGDQPGMPPARRTVVPHEATPRQRVAAVLVVGLLRMLSATVRLRIHNQSGMFEGRATPPVIFCIWHNRLAMAMRTYHQVARPGNSHDRLACMVSASRDGAFLSAVLRAFKVQPVRGSTSRRGRQALLELARWARRGYDLAITPDGPRGPAYQVQPGIIYLAQVTGLPIVPFSYQLGGKISLKSWDRFQLPAPFTTCDLHADALLRVPREADDAERERLRLELERRMMAITKD